jgi:hypothetical protein
VANIIAFGDVNFIMNQVVDDQGKHKQTQQQQHISIIQPQKQGNNDPLHQPQYTYEQSNANKMGGGGGGVTDSFRNAKEESYRQHNI